ncbi:MAG: hypothetical protein M0R37_01505 [Bacteroidales bacterium]|nr:hypothetical protein [Bacteroidales bacterium]
MSISIHKAEKTGVTLRLMDAIKKLPDYSDSLSLSHSSLFTPHFSLFTF